MIKEAEEAKEVAPKEPSKMIIEFSDDLDISSINEKVLDSFRYHKYNLPTLKEKLEKLNKSKSEAPTMIDYKTICKSIKSLSEKIENIESDKDKKDYTEEYDKIIDVYNKHRKKREMIDISVEVESKHKMLSENDIIRVNAIISFLNLASKYIDIEWSQGLVVAEDDNFCTGCGEDVSHIAVTQDGDLICDNCGTVDHVSLVDQMINNSIQLPNAKEYRNEANFMKTFKKFICQQDISFDMDKLCQDLDEYFISIGGKPASYYKSLPMTDRLKKEGTDINLLISGLRAISRKLYEDHNLIGHHLWGWGIPDVSHLEETIMSDYRETQKGYDMMTVEERGRKSCLSRPFRLFKHLQLRGVDCVHEDFKIPVQSDTVKNQESLWEKMCNLSSDPSIYYIPSSNT